jgi:hypothetical protein
LTGKYSSLHTITIFDLFERTYISLVSKDPVRHIQYCTILDRKLCFLRSFEIPYKSCDILHHVIKKDEGIVFGGFGGILHFVKVKHWQPQQATTLEGLTDDINAMTTRKNLIAAGSLAGDVGLWDYTGAKLATVRHDGSQVHSLSIRDERLLVLTRTDAHEYGINLENGTTTVPILPRIEELVKLGVTTWGTYSSDGETILCQKPINVEEQQPLESYRPALPHSLADYDSFTRILSRRHALGKEAAIVIEKLPSGKKIREVSVTPQREISSLWSDRVRLYWTSSDKIWMVDFSFGLSLEAGAKGISLEAGEKGISLAECFSMGLPDSD